jgi:hypothetical protein
MFGGVVAGIVVFAVGAVLDFALTTSPYQHGFDLQTMGVIFMVVGAIAFVLSLVALAFGGAGWRRRNTVMEDDRGNVARRQDTYF